MTHQYFWCLFATSFWEPPFSKIYSCKFLGCNIETRIMIFFDLFLHLTDTSYNRQQERNGFVNVYMYLMSDHDVLAEEDDAFKYNYSFLFSMLLGIISQFTVFISLQNFQCLVKGQGSVATKIRRSLKL